MPSISRSEGTSEPAKCSSVVNMSVTCTLSLLSTPAMMCTDQRMSRGVRMPPSAELNYDPSKKPPVPRPASSIPILRALCAYSADAQFHK